MVADASTKYGQIWSRDELVLALYLYCQIPFAETKATNPEVMRLARFLGRTPSAVARKLGNFGAFDPLLASRGITGLAHYGKGDQEVWEHYCGHWNDLVSDSHELLRRGPLSTPLAPILVGSEEEMIVSWAGTTERTSSSVTRLCQSFFRRAVLSSYRDRCCVCGICIRDLLVASHIVPWSASKELRTAPSNGLCLCALHDRAFDRGIMSVSGSLRVLVAPTLRSTRGSFEEQALSAFEGREITLPWRFAPDAECLRWHEAHVFRRSALEPGA